MEKSSDNHTETHAVDGRPRPCSPAHPDYLVLIIHHSIEPLPLPLRARSAPQNRGRSRARRPHDVSREVSEPGHDDADVDLKRAVLAGRKGCSTYAPISSGRDACESQMAWTMTMTMRWAMAMVYRARWGGSYAHMGAHQFMMPGAADAFGAETLLGFFTHGLWNVGGVEEGGVEYQSLNGNGVALTNGEELELIEVKPEEKNDTHAHNAHGCIHTAKYGIWAYAGDM
ncbi:hypothetical protein V8D89_007575 [Ganoderma adspersum]